MRIVLLTLPILLHCASSQINVDPKVRNAYRLIEACAAGENSIVGSLLNQGLDVNARHPDYGGTCLHYAAYAGKISLVQLLLQYQASLEIQDNFRKTPFFDALFIARSQKPEGYDNGVVKILLENGAQKTINTPNNDGAIPLMFACLYHEPYIVKLLLDYGADPNYNDNGKFWAYRCIERRFESNRETERQKAREIWRLMKAKGAKSPT